MIFGVVMAVCGGWLFNDSVVVDVVIASSNSPWNQVIIDYMIYRHGY